MTKSEMKLIVELAEFLATLDTLDLEEGKELLNELTAFVDDCDSAACAVGFASTGNMVVQLDYSWPSLD